jgi:hypothetical protein
MQTKNLRQKFQAKVEKKGLHLYAIKNTKCIQNSTTFETGKMNKN